ERAAGTAQRDDADAGSCARGPQCLDQSLECLYAECVQLLRPVERDPPDSVSLLVEDVGQLITSRLYRIPARSRSQVASVIPAARSSAFLTLWDSVRGSSPANST